jgi:hypothetical protein
LNHKLAHRVDKANRPARAFLWVLSINLVLVYILIPLDLEHPIWFQWTYDFASESSVPPMASPAWLVELLKGFASIFKRRALDFSPFMQNTLRFPVWVSLWVWLILEARRAVCSTTKHVTEAADCT